MKTALILASFFVVSIAQAGGPKFKNTYPRLLICQAQKQISGSGESKVTAIEIFASMDEEPANDENFKRAIVVSTVRHENAVLKSASLAKLRMLEHGKALVAPVFETDGELMIELNKEESAPAQGRLKSESLGNAELTCRLSIAD